MPHKRKQSSASISEDRAGNVKRLKHDLLITDLPTEILDTILFYALDDPTDFRSATQRGSSKILFTRPILQTCKILRQQALGIINSNTVWMYIHFSTRHVVEDFSQSLPDLPFLPVEFQNYIAEDAASAHISFTNSSLPPPRNTRSFNDERGTFVLPYNFDSLLLICNLVREMAIEEDIDQMKVKYLHTSGHFEQAVHDLINPALSTMHSLASVKFEREGEHYTPDNIGNSVYVRLWHLDNLTAKVNEILQQADTLKKAGYIDESELLVLSSAWPALEAQMLLPPPGAWMMGEVESDTSLYSPDQISFPGRCPKGNRLRQVLFELEYHACLAFSNLSAKYGFDWSMYQGDIFSPAMTRFFTQPSFTWLGLSVSELGKLHYARARMREAIGRDVKRPYTPCGELAVFDCLELSSGLGLSKVDRHYLEEAATEMYFACMLDPKNHDYQNTYSAYKKQLRFKSARSMEKYARERFVLMSDKSTGLSSKKIVWAGDWMMIKRCGGEVATTNWLPLAQKGLEISPTIEDWLESISHNQQKAFLRQGARYQREAFE